ncbi:MAG: NADH-quinone oxidoreductase subunit NuoG [Rickettsiales bacterium]|nr:NADH-quinone oxidoreductase subunit NuoG [Rickettsiales bacterium]
MPKLTIDGNEIEVADGSTVIQACEQAGVEIPRFCYHDRLKIAGNCRMCLVEVSPGPPKPAASCALPVSEGMTVKTDTPMVKKAREGVMEFLLINHPLDCPICDQGGECDLQDQARNYGTGFSRYAEHKRAVETKDMGPLIKTHMTRCIHCTRCVRFADDVAGVPELGAVGRGEHMEITTEGKAFASELSGNVIDLCPVGALTSRPYAFVARPWELKKTESIDVHDAMGSNVRIDVRGNNVMRVLPRLNEEVNEEWLGDKSRYACDGLRRQRLDTPYLRVQGKLQPVSWDEAFAAISEKFEQSGAKKLGAITGDMIPVEPIYALKTLMDELGSANRDCRQDGTYVSRDERGEYLFNSGFAGVEEADAIVLIGTNPRAEAPVLNARIRKAWLNNGTPIAVIGQETALTYPVEWLGESPAVLGELISGNGEFAKILKKAKRPLIIVGQAAMQRDDGQEIYAAARTLAQESTDLKTWNGFNVLQTSASRTGALDVGFMPAKGGFDSAEMLEASRSGEIEMLYLLGADELDMSQIGGNCFVIYQGHHGDNGAHRADVILPSAAYTEQDGTYVNMEGRVQRSFAASFAPGEARPDWKIIRALSELLGRKLPFDELSTLRAQMIKAHPHLGELDVKPVAALSNTRPRKTFKFGGNKLSTYFTNYYMTDAISRASATMAECTAVFIDGKSSQKSKGEAA